MSETTIERGPRRCSFAYPGTYGHECGRPAVVVFVFRSERTVSGEFFAGRCAECKDARAGRDNQGIVRREPVGDQKNEWRP